MIRFRKRSNETTDHNYFEERLSAYLDGELAARERRAVEQHLKTCERCRRELAALKQTVAWLSELPVVPVPRVFAIPAKMVPAPPVRHRRSLVPAMQFATALAAVLLFFAAAGDVMLTGWPWGRAAEPMMLQEAVVEQTVADAPAAKEVAATFVVEEATYAEPYGASGVAAAPAPVTGEVAAPAPAAAEAAMVAEEPAAGAGEAGVAEKEAVVVEMTEETAMMMQAPPEDTAQETALAESAANEGVGGAAPGDQAQETDAGARVQADTPPVVPATPAPEAVPVDTPGPLPTPVPEPLPTATAVPPSAPTEAPVAAVVPAPTALPTIHASMATVQEPPAALVQAPESVARAGEGREEAEPVELTDGDASWAVFWLRVVEYVLGVTLVVLTGATISLMAWRRGGRRR